MFPDRQYDAVATYARDYFIQYANAVANIAPEQLTAAIQSLRGAIEQDRLIFSCGNGGSAAISNHFSCDCLKGARNETTIKPRVVSLSATVELITAIANDIDYDQVFTYQLQSLSRPGDVLIAISSSGSSPNIVSALRWAKENGMKTIAFTGFSGGAAAKTADVSLHVPADNYGIVEDAHQALMHVLAQYLRHENLYDPKQLGRVKF